MLKFYLYKNRIIRDAIIIAMLVFSNIGFSQKNQEIYISDKLKQIDSLIEIKQLDKALTLVNNTQNTFAFKSDANTQQEFDYRYVQILYESGEQDKALEKCLEGYEKLDPSSPLYLNYVYFLSKMFANTRNYDKAIYYNKIALTHSQSKKDTVSLIRSLVRIGTFYFAKNDLDSAKFYLRKVIHSNYALNSKTEKRISNAYNNLGVIAQYEDNYPLAKHYAREAIEIKIKQRDTLGFTSLSINLGNLYFNEKKYKIAIEKYLSAGELIDKDSSMDAMALKKVIYENLSLAHDSLKDYQSAYHYLLNSRDLDRALNESILNENLAETEAKFNLAREEQKTEAERNNVLRTQFLFYGLAFLTLTFFIIVLIFYKNYKLKQQNKLEQVQNDIQTRIINATIDAKEKERKTIAEILHDSVSALLSSANLHLQASKSQMNTKAPVEITKAQQIVGEASVKIRDLSHDLISSVLLKFGLAFAVHDMCEKYSNSEFTLISDANGIKRYNQKFEIKIHNIIEELINNVIKHSKAKNASIMLSEKEGNKLIIQIIDDGRGFDVKKVFNKKGLGLSHIEARIKVMKGVFNINSKRGEGTSIFISAPIYIEEVAETG